MDEFSYSFTIASPEFGVFAGMVLKAAVLGGIYMNKKRIGFSALVLAVLAGGLTFSGISSAEEEPQKEAEAVVQSFADLLANQKYEEAAALVDDPRFATEEEQIQAYKENENSDEKIENFRIVSVDVKDDKSAEVEVEFTTKAVGTQHVTLPIGKKGKQWKIVFRKVKEFPYAKSQKSDFIDGQVEGK